MHGISYYRGDGSVFDLADRLGENIERDPEGNNDAKQKALAELEKEVSEYMMAAMEMDWEEEKSCS